MWPVAAMLDSTDREHVHHPRKFCWTALGKRLSGCCSAGSAKFWNGSGDPWTIEVYAVQVYFSFMQSTVGLDSRTNGSRGSCVVLFASPHGPWARSGHNTPSSLQGAFIIQSSVCQLNTNSFSLPLTTIVPVSQMRSWGPESWNAVSNTD